jgi:acyl dehydratase
MTHEISKFYYEDIKIGAEYDSPLFPLEQPVMTEFARLWDPLPIHLDDAAAAASGFGGITASGSFLLAVKNRLLYQLGIDIAAIASFGFDEVRFKAPGRPRDLVQLRLRWVEKRPSGSRPGAGIAKHFCELMRDDGTVLLSLFDTILISARGEFSPP